MAPAMIYDNTTIICGHSIEINCVSDINLNLSLNQIQLVSALIVEYRQLFNLSSDDDDDNDNINQQTTKKAIRFPYKRFEQQSSNIKTDSHLLFDEFNEVNELNNDIFKDSGIDTSEIQSLLSSKSRINHHSVSYNDDFIIFLALFSK